MNKGTISDIKPGMLVKLVGSVGPDLGIVYHADSGTVSTVETILPPEDGLLHFGN